MFDSQINEIRNKILQVFEDRTSNGRSSLSINKFSMVDS